MRPGLGLHFLYLFSGPRDQADGFAAALRELGATCDDRDVANGSGEDLADDEVWQDVRDGLKTGRYHGKFGTPPSRTFTAPRALRDVEGPGTPAAHQNHHRPSGP